MKFNIEKSTDLEDEYISEMLLKHNKENLKLKQKDPYKKFSYVVKENNKVIAGIIGYSVLWKIFYIDTLWVKKEYRNKKIGTNLLNFILNKAKKYGCHIVHLDSFEFQGVEFYLKNGFEIFGILEDSPKGYKEYFLKKVLK
ncbi:GNAT family N-acetyltransferase [Streptobacillus felis]|uniref:GNAT family N-acetyltransferase n=1 Tax=Streptobacillus felis TaxID=1384509 RepID=UPI00082C5D7D|nr:GNAT family N-acetyltransferase [Streptobacillus felis]